MLPFLLGWMLVTAYAPGCGDSGITATGTHPSWGTIASRSRDLLWERLDIPGYGSGLVLDRMSPRARADLDVWFPTCWQARQWGRRRVLVSQITTTDEGAVDDH